MVTIYKLLIGNGSPCRVLDAPHILKFGFPGTSDIKWSPCEGQMGGKNKS